MLLQYLTGNTWVVSCFIDRWVYLIARYIVASFLGETFKKPFFFFCLFSFLSSSSLQADICLARKGCVCWNSFEFGDIYLLFQMEEFELIYVDTCFLWKLSAAWLDNDKKLSALLGTFILFSYTMINSFIKESGF